MVSRRWSALGSPSPSTGSLLERARQIARVALPLTKGSRVLATMLKTSGSGYDRALIPYSTPPWPSRPAPASATSTRKIWIGPSGVTCLPGWQPC